MSEFPSLAEVLAKHQIQTSWYGQHDGWWECTCQGGEFATAWTPEHVAMEWKEARTITTVEQLDALPHLSLALRRYVSAAGWQLHEVWEKRNEVWHCIAAPLSPPSGAIGEPQLPALLIHHPDWATS